MSSEGYVIYVADTETTGFCEKTQDVIEISMSRLILTDGLYQEESQKSWLVKAMNPKTISEEALSKNGHKREDILHLTKFGKENYKLPADVINEIDMWMLEDNVSSIDRVFAGQNPMFDVRFLQEFWKRENRTDFPFEIGNGNRVLDTKTIATFFDVCTGRRRKHYSLGALVKACGVKKDKAHRADGDVRMTRDLVLFMVNMVKEPVSIGFKDCYADDE